MKNIFFLRALTTMNTKSVDPECVDVITDRITKIDKIGFLSLVKKRLYQLSRKMFQRPSGRLLWHL